MFLIFYQCNSWLCLYNLEEPSLLKCLLERGNFVQWKWKKVVESRSLSPLQPFDVLFWGMIYHRNCCKQLPSTCNKLSEITGKSWSSHFKSPGKTSALTENLRSNQRCVWWQKQRNLEPTHVVDPCLWEVSRFPAKECCMQLALLLCHPNNAMM